MIVHSRTRTGNIRNNCFSMCIILTRPTYHPFVAKIENNEKIILFINNNICWITQLIILASLPIFACNGLTTRCTILPFYNTIIFLVSGINCLIIIDIDILWVKLLSSIVFNLSLRMEAKDWLRKDKPLYINVPALHGTWTSWVKKQ